MSDCNLVSTPSSPGAKLTKSEIGTSEDDVEFPYRELIGSLMYLAVGTRPDIAFTVSHLGQFNNCYDGTHWAAAKRVLRYLKGSIYSGLEYKFDETPLVGYVADWASCIVDRRSYTSFVFILNGAAISWDSKKQRTIVLSSTEAEYMALSEAAKESIYWRGFLIELGVNLTGDIVLKCDNMGTSTEPQQESGLPFPDETHRREAPLHPRGTERRQPKDRTHLDNRNGSGHIDKRTAETEAPLLHEGARFVQFTRKGISRGSVRYRGRFVFPRLLHFRITARR